MSGRLAGKSILITGAASGIGRATALRCLSEDAQVGLIDVSAEGLKEVEGEARSRDGEAVTVVADIADETSIGAAVEHVVATLGSLDVVIANAAVNLPDDLPVHEIETRTWRRAIEVNLTGTFLTCKHGLPHLLRAGGGAIIVTASPSAFYAAAPSKHAYSASKGGVLALMKAMAITYASNGIRVNAIVPGFTDTPFVSRAIANADARQAILERIPLGRPARPEDAAEAMVYLASDESSYVTGIALFVDGGMTAV